MLAGKIALVTGAGRGVGRSHALALAAAGATVMVNDLGLSARGTGSDNAPARAVVKEIRAAGSTAEADGSDVADWGQAARLIERTVERFGRLDALVNNAGISFPTAFGQLDEADWDRMMDVNAKSVAGLVDAAARHWRKEGSRPGRSIVCTASGSGSNPHYPLGVYGASKAAVLAIAQVAAEELAPLGIRVNALGPTARTRMVASAMEGIRADVENIMPPDADYDLYQPAHVSRLMLYLVSDLCRFTGRFFGVRADDVVVFDGWTATHHVENGRKPWTTEGLAKALEAVPVQQPVKRIGPMGRIEAPFPGDAILEQLARS
jgi:NAD(P)-dependent dehydrogenase (short-subunit alcohol dehydrogenase family)